MPTDDGLADNRNMFGARHHVHGHAADNDDWLLHGAHGCISENQ
jgi:hypothetical protein